MILFLIIICLANLIYWIFLFRKLSNYDAKSEISDTPIVLVVLAVRNEEQNIQNHLGLILEQEYPNAKVLVIDDYSTDSTFSVLKDFSARYPHLQIRRNEKHLGKKKSIQAALQDVGENQNLLVFTDGDCRCNSSRWLQLMTDGFSDKTQLVLGYGPLNKGKSLLNRFARYETFLTALQYFSYAIAGIPYMGVGRNLAYQKELFNKVNGFSRHLEVQSGDDDLFVNQVATRDNVFCQLDPDSFMYSDAPKSWGQFFRQKKRHLTTSVRYKCIHQILLSGFALSHICFYLLLFSVNWKTAMVFWLIRQILIIGTNYNAFYKLREKDLLYFFPILDLMLFFYYTFMGFYSIVPQKTRWK